MTNQPRRCLDESAGSQIEDLLPVDGGVKGEVKVLQVLLFRKLGLAQTSLQQPVPTAGQLVINQQLKELLMAEPSLDGLLQANVKDLSQAREPEVTKFSFQF